MDIHRLSYGCPSVFKLTSVSLYIDFHRYLSRRPSAFIRSSISSVVESITFHRDIHNNLCGRPLAFIGTFIRTSVDVHQFSSRHPSSLRTSISADVHRLSYGCPSVLKLTSVSFYIKFYHYLSGRPSAFIRTSIIANLDVCFQWRSNSTSKAIHQFSSRHPSSLWTSISYQTDVHKNLCGRPLAFI